MKYDVTAVEVSTSDGSVQGEPRTERIDTVTNILFRTAVGPWNVEDVYHAFWNRMNDSWENIQRPTKVVVLRVEKVV